MISGTFAALPELSRTKSIIVAHARFSTGLHATLTRARGPHAVLQRLKPN